MDVQWDTKLTLVSDSIKKTYMWIILIEILELEAEVTVSHWRSPVDLEFLS